MGIRERGIAVFVTFTSRIGSYVIYWFQLLYMYGYINCSHPSPQTIFSWYSLLNLYGIT